MLRTARAAYRHYSGRDGSREAAAVTYFAFLSVFPVLALSFAAVGLVSQRFPGADGVLNAVLQGLLPGMIGDEPGQISLAAIQDAAGATAGVGVFAMLYAGLNWISATRDALADMFEVESSRPPAFGRRMMRAALSARARDTVALLAIGLILLVSVAVSAGLLNFLRRLGRLVGVDDLGFIMPVLLVAAGVATGTVLFFAMFRVLARAPVPDRALWSGAVVGALGFEVLKQASTWLLGTTSRSPAFQAFGIALILLVWIYYFCRLLLFSASWAATYKSGDDSVHRDPKPADRAAPRVEA